MVGAACVLCCGWVELSTDNGVMVTAAPGASAAERREVPWSTRVAIWTTSRTDNLAHVFVKNVGTQDATRVCIRFGASLDCRYP